MDMFAEVEAKLGIDVSSTFAVLSAELVRADRDMIEVLISLRLAKGITQEDIAHTLGRNKSAVSNFERLGADPHLSTIRRYAAAVGARVRHIVEDAGGEHVLREGSWIAVPARRRATHATWSGLLAMASESGSKSGSRELHASWATPHIDIQWNRNKVVEGHIVSAEDSCNA